MYLSKRTGNLHQLTQLDGAAEKARRRHHKRKHHGCLTKEAGEPDQVFLRLDQLQVVAQQPGEAAVKLHALHSLALVQSYRFAVFPHPHHVVAKVGLIPLLFKIQLDLRAPDVMRQHTARHAIQDRHPHHEAGDVVVIPLKRKRKPARQSPQNADEAGQCHNRVEQSHRQADGVAGEQIEVFLNPLVRVVRVGRFGIQWTGETGEFQFVIRVSAQPALQVMARHPGTPAHFQQLRQVELVNSDDDIGERQIGEAPQLRPEHVGLLVLQRVIKELVPLVEQDRHVDQTQIQRNDGQQQAACFPAFVRFEVGG